MVLVPGTVSPVANCNLTNLLITSMSSLLISKNDKKIWFWPANYPWYWWYKSHAICNLYSWFSLFGWLVWYSQSSKVMLTVKFMHPCGGPRKNLLAANRKWYLVHSNQEYFCVVSSTTPTGRTYKIQDEEYRKTLSAYELFKQNNK